ncbi:MAG: LamG-like jellyroll fold domain-containing protein, partial [Saprospiraceae bacterium]
ESILNFTDGITVSLFIQPLLIGDKERFIISHGSWQNRWKLSITPDRKVRWTLKNASGAVKDLDSESVLEENKFYHVAATYNGRFMMIYINGLLESFTPFSGELNASPVDLEIGQIMPDDPSYNFRGVLDEIKIYDFALLPDSVASESGIVITGIEDVHSMEGLQWGIYPNPATHFITIQWSPEKNVSPFGKKMTILDFMGRETLSVPFDESPAQQVDIHSLSPGLYFVRAIYQGRTFIKKMIVE